MRRAARTLAVIVAGFAVGFLGSQAYEQNRCPSEDSCHYDGGRWVQYVP